MTTTRLILASIALVAVTRALGAQQASSPARDNLAIPAGTVHGAPAELGAIEVIGNGPVPLILIPGAPLGGDVWRGFATRNRARYTSFLVTLPGYAGTPPPPADDRTPRPWSDGVVAALVRLVETRRLDRPVFVANHLMASYYAVRASTRLACGSGGVIALASDPVAGDPFSFTGRLLPDERARRLDARWRPFFREVTAEQWAAGTLPAIRLSADAERGSRFRLAAIETPLWLQLRYYLEYLSDDISTSIATSRTPILAVNARFALAGYADPLVQAMSRRYGSLGAAEDSLTVQTFWPERLGISGPRLEQRQLAGSTLVMMDDTPEVVDDLVSEFVATRRPAVGRAGTGPGC